jgi:hypothetical protein
MKTPIEDAFSTLPDTPARAHCVSEYRNTDITEISTFSTSLGRLGSKLFVPLRCYQSGNHAQIFTGVLKLELQSLTFQLFLSRND